MIWIIFQGWLIATGRSREPLMGLVVNALRIGFLSFVAATFAFMGTDIGDLLGNTMPKAITGVVTGKEQNPASSIDDNLKVMTATFALMDAYAASAGGSGGDEAVKQQLSKITTMSAVGTAGPAVIGGALLLMYKVALGLFVGFGPLFILCLIFPSTKQLFSKWLYYGIGTMFSLALLTFMVGVASNIVVAVGAAMLVKYGIIMQGQGAAEGMNTIAMQQGGLGLILTILLITCPPMAAQFFNGTIGGAFMTYSQFGHTQPDAARESKGGGAIRDGGGNVIGQQQAAPSITNNNRSSGMISYEKSSDTIKSANQNQRGSAANDFSDDGLGLG